MFIVACYFALEGDAIYNVADLFGPNGELVGRYRKVHLPQYELWQVTAGDVFPAFETALGWISMLICYDQMWPESAAWSFGVPGFWWRSVSVHWVGC